uniref:Uncharacterized protein n=1 Tax=Tanacetum cinerariifolium TaxID=118510 RepID=A0A6L2LMU2_TANCI|nr:hypothetical protein [Tanacetum cinerariifolium]
MMRLSSLMKNLLFIWMKLLKSFGSTLIYLNLKRLCARHSKNLTIFCKLIQTYLLRTLRDSRPMKITRRTGSMNETRTCRGSMRNQGLTLEFRPNPHQLNILASLLTIRLGVQNGQRVGKDDVYCNGGNLPGTYINGNQLHYQDYEWYEALEDNELKYEALRNKAIIEGFLKHEDESRYEPKKRWNVYTNYDGAYEINHDDNKRKELCEVHKLPVCNVRRYKMIKYSFNNDEEYVAIKKTNTAILQSQKKRHAELTKKSIR